MSVGIAEVLRTAPVFRKLSEDDRARVAAHAQVRQYPRGSLIFSEGEPFDTFYMVTSGRVKVFKMTLMGKDVILEIFGVGDRRPLAKLPVLAATPRPDPHPARGAGGLLGAGLIFALGLLGLRRASARSPQSARDRAARGGGCAEAIASPISPEGA